MRIATLALWSVLGMGTTSLVTWALTPPGLGLRAETMVSSAGSGLAALAVAAPGATLETGGPVVLSSRLGHAVLPANAPGETYVYAELTPTAGSAVSRPAPASLAIVLDRSGSMAGKRIENAIAAAQQAVRRLRDGDVVSVVAYDNVAELIVPPTVIGGATRDGVVRALSGLSVRGDTCISCGLDQARALLAERAGLVSRILLLSDGEATAGVTSVEGFRAIAQGLRDAEVPITTIGVDVTYNERVMAALAEESNGRHYFVQHADGLPRIFDQELERLAKTIATEGELTVDPGPGVEVLEVYDRVHRRDGNRIVLPLGAFTAGEPKTVLLRVRTPASAPGTQRVAAMTLAYRDLAQDAVVRHEGVLAAETTTETARVSTLDPVVDLRLGRSEARAALYEANDLYRLGRRAEAQQRLDRARAANSARRTAVTKAAPTARPKLDADLARQQGALDNAYDGFDERPARASAPAQVRSNAGEAVEMGY